MSLSTKCADRFYERISPAFSKWTPIAQEIGSKVGFVPNSLMIVRPGMQVQQMSLDLSDNSRSAVRISRRVMPNCSDQHWRLGADLRGASFDTGQQGRNDQARRELHYRGGVPRLGSWREETVQRQAARPDHRSQASQRASACRRCKAVTWMGCRRKVVAVVSKVSCNIVVAVLRQQTKNSPLRKPPRYCLC